VSPATIDTPAARARSVRLALARRGRVDLEQRFLDAAGVEHQIRSAPVPGGRYLYDASQSWGLRALGFCPEGCPEDLIALSEDYARCAARRSTPLSRELRLSDLLRRAGAETPVGK
jgi:hypothetical protein